MKIAKLFGLATVAALVLTASLAVGSASAVPTTLCKTGNDTPYCPSGDRFPEGTQLNASSNNVEFETNIGNVTCSESTFESKTGAEAAEPLPMNISSWTFGGCKTSETACTSKTENLPFAGSLSWTSSWNGQLSVKDSGAGQPRLRLICSGQLWCVWKLEPSMELQSGPGQLVIAKTTLTKITGLLCPATTTIEATYAVSTPTNFFVARAESPPAEPTTALCKGFELYCSPANLYSSGTELSGTSSNFTIDMPSGYILGDLTCKSATFSAKSGADYGQPLPMEHVEMAQFNCSDACEVKAVGLYSGTVTRHNADGRWKGGGAAWRVTCVSISCKYTIPDDGSWITVEHGTPGTIRIDRSLSVTAETSTCPTSARVVADYPLDSPSGSLYVTDAVR